MAERGGKRKPPARTPPGGPGRFSRRSDGSQPIREPDIDNPDLQYGDRQMLTEGQRIAPLPAGRTPSAGGQPGAAGQPSLAGGLPPWMMDSPSAFPEEPVTAAGCPRADAPVPRRRQLRRATERRRAASAPATPQRARARGGATASSCSDGRAADVTGGNRATPDGTDAGDRGADRADAGDHGAGGHRAAATGGSAAVNYTLGQAIGEAGNPRRVYPSDRVCEHRGCTTMLSRYNPKRTCYLHSPVTYAQGGPKKGRKRKIEAA